MVGGEPPSWHPPRFVLEVAELVLTGALAEPPVPVELPDGVAGRARAAGAVVLEDAEGAPVARLDVAAAVGAALSPIGPFTQGPLRSRRRTPAEVAVAGPVLVVLVRGLLRQRDVDAVAGRAAATGWPVLWLVVVGAGRRPGVPPEGLLRAVTAAADDVVAQAAVARRAPPPGAAGDGPGATVVPVAVPVLPGVEDDELLRRVAAGYGAAEVMLPAAGRPAAGTGDAGTGDAGGDDGWHPASAREGARFRRPPGRRGVTVFFTGLSGSGKSTIARGLAERLLDDGSRTVTLLDGDEVRRLLSHGLGFSRADRDLNIRRIGFVAAEVTRHGGLAICAPIAPFEAVRAEVRELVEESGDFVLVHVSTPLAECERRDRKGLYARARQQGIPDFTGISSPYEVPPAADLRIDTTGLPVADAVARVWDLLTGRGHLGPAGRGDGPAGRGDGPAGRESG